MKKGITVFSVIIAIVLASTIAWHRYRVPTKSLFFSLFPVFASVSVAQPILFNHIHHLEVAKLTCTFCHRYVEEYRSAGIPNIDLCQACHSTDAISKRPEAIKVMGYVKGKREIPWQRMYELPDHVVFPHWIHIRSKIDCPVCHGVTGVKERPVKMVDRNYMEWCMDCHTKRGASIDCYTCHSS